MTREKRDLELFDKIACKYAKKDATTSSSIARRSQILSALTLILYHKPNLGTIVDIGCGIGAAAKYLDGHYERYIGIDQSEKMVEAAVIFNKDNPRVEFLAKNIKAKDLPENIADTVLCVGALHHMTDLDCAMESIARIAKPGAYIAAIEPQRGNPLVQAMRRVRSLLDVTYSSEQVYFSEKELRDIFTKHGITEVLFDYQGFFTPPFAQVVMNPQRIFGPISRLAIKTDFWLNAHLPFFFKKLSFNIVVWGRFKK